MNIQWHDFNTDEIEWLDWPEDDTDYYERLEVSAAASPEVIKRACHVLAARYHPDKHPDAKKAWAEEMMKLLNVAYTTLSNQGSRREYDAIRMARKR